MKKTPSLLLTLVLLAACSPESGPEPTTPSAPAADTPTTANEQASPIKASAAGTVESVDPADKTITIAHGPVDVLKWPAMTMRFEAPVTDLTTIHQGDRVTFEFTARGMHGTITKIEHE